MLIKRPSLHGAGVLVVNRLDAFSWGSQEHTGEQLPEVEAGRRKLSAASEPRKPESGRSDGVTVIQLASQRRRQRSCA